MNKLSMVGVALAITAGSAHADVFSRTHTLSNGALSAFAVVHVDLDDATDVVSVWTDYQGFGSDVTTITLDGQSGEFSIALTHDGGIEGFGHATGFVGPSGEVALKLGAAQIRFGTAALPGGELVALVGSGGSLGVEASLDASQIPAGSASDATGTTFLTISLAGTAQVSGFLQGLTSAVTSVEVRGPAWFGDDGPLIALGPASMTSASAANFSFSWMSANAQAVDVLEDGMAYMLVRTVNFPFGELRGQLAGQATGVGPIVGKSYCPARPNSVNFNAATMFASGSLIAADNDLLLSAVWMPANKPVLPIVGFTTGHAFNLPASAGTLCIGGGPIGRLSNHLGIVSPSETFTTPIDLSLLPFGTATAGQVLNFQLWYRDTDSFGHATTNFSNAISIRYY